MTDTIKLMETLKVLFASGADENHSEEEMLALLEPVNFCGLIHPITHEADSVYDYIVNGGTLEDGPIRYRGNRLFGPDAFRLYVDQVPETSYNGVVCQRSLELWLLTNMQLAVCSCMHIKGKTLVTEYRQIKSCDWRETEIQIDFLELADTLVQISKLPQSGTYPFYER